MDRPTALLQALLNQLKNWGPRISRSVAASSLEFKAGAPTGEFSVVVKWQPKQGPEVEYVKVFNRDFVFGPSMTLSPMAWRTQKKACDYAREIINEILSQRGVL